MAVVLQCKDKFLSCKLKERLIPGCYFRMEGALQYSAEPWQLMASSRTKQSTSSA